VVVPGMPVVNEVVEFRSLEPGAVEEMVCRGLMPQRPSDAIKLYPDYSPRRAHRHRARRQVVGALDISVRARLKD